MKIIRRKTETFEFDYNKEIKRLKKCFKGEQLRRQLDIIEAMFKEKNLNKVEELYFSLPYCEKEECPEQEFVGLWIYIFAGGWGENEYLVDEDTTYEF